MGYPLMPPPHMFAQPTRFDRGDLRLLVCCLLASLALHSKAQEEISERDPIVPGSGVASEDALDHFKVRDLPFGPWGHLEYSGLILEPSDYYLAFSPDLNSWRDGMKTRWVFAAKTKEEVVSLLETIDLTGDQISALTDGDRLFPDEVIGSLAIEPSEEEIRALTAEQRTKLYPTLLPHDFTNPYFEAFALPPGGIRDIAILPSSLSEETIALIEELTYMKGSVPRFSDIILLFQRTASEEERRDILKFLAREVSLTVRLFLSDQSNLDELETYWGAGGRNREVLPFLEAVVSTPGVDRIDIAHLLPPTPRKLIQTYPSSHGYVLPTSKPDCFWTSVSFFSDSPSDRHLDFTRPVIEDRFEVVPPPYRLGDLILITDGDTGDWIHACNFIAEDLVFTKNGRSTGRPWIFSTFEFVMQSYQKVENLEVTYLRLRPEFRQ